MRTSTISPFTTYPKGQEVTPATDKLHTASHVPNKFQFPEAIKCDSELTLINSLGSGRYGKVYCVKHGTTQYALKVGLTKEIDKASFRDRADSQKSMNDEALCYSKLKHKNILKCKKIYQTRKSQDCSGLLLELGESSLTCKMNEEALMRVTPQKINQWVLNLLEGLEYIHSKGIVHCDIRPSNIICMADGQLKIADFGLAEDIGVNGIRVSCPLDKYNDYVAPEIKNRAKFGIQDSRGNRKLYDHGVDVYALGVIVRQMALLANLPEHHRKILLTLAKSAMTKDAVNRPSSSELLGRFRSQLSRM